jgi:hypothetical protein
MIAAATSDAVAPAAMAAVDSELPRADTCSIKSVEPLPTSMR